MKKIKKAFYKGFWRSEREMRKYFPDAEPVSTKTFMVETLTDKLLKAATPKTIAITLAVIIEAILVANYFFG